jgi:flagellar biosynthesis/type III secretory pathway chaperone
MKMKKNNLEKILRKEKKICMKLLEIEKSKTDALINIDLVQLEKYTKKTEEIATLLDKLENERIKLNDKIQVLEKENNPDYLMYKTELREMFILLKDHIKKNNALLRQNQDIINRTLNHIGNRMEVTSYQEEEKPAKKNKSAQPVFLNMTS